MNTPDCLDRTLERHGHVAAGVVPLVVLADHPHELAGMDTPVPDLLGGGDDGVALFGEVLPLARFGVFAVDVEVGGAEGLHDGLRFGEHAEVCVLLLDQP